MRPSSGLSRRGRLPRSMREGVKDRANDRDRELQGVKTTAEESPQLAAGPKGGRPRAEEGRRERSARDDGGIETCRKGR